MGNEDKRDSPDMTCLGGFGRILYFAMIIILLGSLAAEADKPSQVDVEVWLDPLSGYAIGGYDPVAYFTRREATEGDEQFQYDLNDIYWKFENSGNLEVFKKHPHIYRPQFAGYDPYALANGITIKGLPTVWIMRKNRLYFFHSIINRRLWMDDQEGFLDKAIEAWPRLSKELVHHIELE